ncbi:MAG: DUF2750 domain-containing protein [Pseudomonadota bacterium]|nr:DUF2750 domain-containing protein [Gammaproteobacteria bacterium]MBU2546730.1 DUF2750 domain-containing protein [Gammaproteobacteria bacterium]
MKITQKQIEAVIALPGPKRYAHFIKVAADQRQVWGLYLDGWALAGTSDETPVFPIWPAKEYALLCATKDWAQYEAKAIDLDYLLETLIPNLKDDQVKLGVFYTPNDKGVLPELDQFTSDIRMELDRIE